MNKLHTPWQYLLDIVGASRLKEAEASGDAAYLKQQQAYYLGLDESECTFTVPYQHPDNKKYWLTNMTCLPRKFKLNRLRFNTGKIDSMIEPNAAYITDRNSLNLSTVSNLYRVYDQLDTYHLLVKKGDNLEEALQMTGFRFEANEYAKVLYDARDKQFEADGHFEITTPIVAGRIYITYVTRDLDAEAAEARLLEEEAKAKLANADQDKAPEPEETVSEGKGDVPPAEETAPVVEPKAEEKKDADVAEEKEPEVKPEEAPVQNFNKFNNKKK